MNIGYIVSTNIDYMDITVPKLINSFTSTERVHVFVGKSRVNYNYRIGEGPIYHYVQYGAYEHTALIGAVEFSLPYDAVFLLHDTCEVGPNFEQLVKDGASDNDMTVIWNAMCGFGLYKLSLLHRIKPYLDGLKDCDKHTAMVQEGQIFRSKMGTASVYPNDSYINKGTQDIYGTGKHRLIEYYGAVDLYKYKANYGNTTPDNYIVRI